MNYSIRASVYESKKESSGNTIVRGFCDLVFGDSIKVTNIAILENKATGELFVSMPRYLSNERDEQGNQIYKEVCNPTSKEFRDELYSNVLKAYGRALNDDKAVLTVDAQDKQRPDFNVSVTPYEKEGSQIRGLARVYINDSFVIGNIHIVQGSSGLFVTMPSYKTNQVDEKGKDVYRDICFPVTKDFRERLFSALIEEYGNRKEKAEEDFESYIEQQALNEVQGGKKKETGNGGGTGNDGFYDPGEDDLPFH